MQEFLLSIEGILFIRSVLIVLIIGENIMICNIYQ